MTDSANIIRTEDDHIVSEGERVYDYYNMKAGTIVPGSLVRAPDVWFDVRHDDGTIAILNGARICTIGYAQSRGWPGSE